MPHVIFNSCVPLFWKNQESKAELHIYSAIAIHQIYIVDINLKRKEKVKEWTNQTSGNSLKKPKVDFFSGKLNNKGILWYNKDDDGETG